jgi:sulfopyruvate decarboxylase TPP-binding subunit
MFTGEQLVAELAAMGITHVVWLPDSTLGTWESALASSPNLRLIRVCREGEAWAVAAGLHLAGARPLVMIQCTGLFESGDSLRNAIHDYGLPLFAVIGYRSFLLPSPPANDSARTFTEPFLQAFQIEYKLIDAPDKLPLLREHYERCRHTNQPGAVLIAEGKM